MPCTLTSTAILRRLRAVGVVRGEDLIAPCAETQVGDTVINDRLRKVSALSGIAMCAHAHSK